MIDIFFPTIRKDSKSLDRAIDTARNSVDFTHNMDNLEVHVIQEGKSYAEAINIKYTDLRHKRSRDDWFFCGADDLRFEKGWLDEALKTHMETGARVIGTNDLHNSDVIAGVHATHYLVQYGYIEDCGGTFDQSFPVLYHYKHNYTDTEFIKTAKARGEFYYSPKSIVEHMHPGWGLNTVDPGYENSMNTMREDKRTHDQRMAIFYAQEIPKTRAILSKVAIFIPNMGTLNVHLVDAIRVWTMLGCHVEMISYFSPVDRARNYAVQKFLALPGHITHMLFVDSDTIPPIDAIEKMMKQDRPIVTGITPITDGIQNEHLVLYYNAFKEVFPLGSQDLHEKGRPGISVDRFTGSVKVDRCGMSCCLISRDVLKAMAEKFDIDTDTEWLPDAMPYEGTNDRLWFNFRFDEITKTWVSEDFDFCIKAKHCGFSIVADTSVICKHAKTIII